MGSNPIPFKNNGAYPLTLIKCRKGNWLHVGSTPTAPINLNFCKDNYMNDILEGIVQIFCEKCGKEILEDYRKDKSKKQRFCSIKCARGFSTKNKRKEINKKVSKKLTKNIKNFCEICGKEISHKNNQKLCKDCKPSFRKYDNKYYYVKDYRKKIKQKAVDYKGGKCEICGYNFCNRALVFHHLDESKKDFTISRNCNRKWEYTKKELNTGKLTTMLFCDVGDTLLLIDKPYELKPKEINAIHQQMIELGWIQ